VKRFTVLALAVAIGLATAGSPYASSAPDGLEKVAADHAFVERGTAQAAPVADYAMPGIGDPRLATGLAGLLGTLVVFGVGYAIARRASAR
jgi:hypothetical protein